MQRKYSIILAVLFLFSNAGYSGDSSLSEFANELANLNQKFESVCNEEKFNPGSPRQRKIFEQRDRLYQRITEHIEKKILSMQFDDTVPFFQTEISSIKNLTIHKIRDFLSDKSLEKNEIRKKLLIFLIDYAKDDHGLLLLEVCSKNSLCRDILKPRLKEIFLTREIHPFLLEFLPELYQDEDIMRLFDFKVGHILSDALRNFDSAGPNGIGFDDYFYVAGLLMFARNGNKGAEDAYLSFVTSSRSPNSYNTLAGCAVISTSRSYDVLFERLNDFRRYSYSGHTVSSAVVSLLHRTIADFPPGPGKWVREPFLQKDARKYIDWIRENKESYKLRALTPYDLFSLLVLRFRADQGKTRLCKIQKN